MEVEGFNLSYSDGMNIRSSSKNCSGYGASALNDFISFLKGSKMTIADNAAAVTLGAIPINDCLKKWDQQKLPIVKNAGPRYISWYIAVLMESLPGVGLLQ